MPFIDVKTSCELNDEKIERIKSDLGKSISLIPGKSENWLMVNIADNCNLYFKGSNNENTAFVNVSIFGETSKANCEKLTAEICNILENSVGIPSDRVYVKFEFSDMWGYNKFIF